MKTATEKQNREPGHPAAGEPGITLAPELGETLRDTGRRIIPPTARLASVDGFSTSTVNVTVDYGTWSEWSSGQSIHGELVISGVKPAEGYGHDALISIDVPYGDKACSFGSDGMTFGDFDAVVLALVELRDRAISDGLFSAPKLSAFEDFPMEAM